MYNCEIDELLFDYDEVYKYIRRESAYWTHWGIIGPRLENDKIPTDLRQMTGEIEGRQKPKREMTPERKSRLEKAMQAHQLKRGLLQ